MDPIQLTPFGTKILADTLTPVSIFPRIRDRYPNSLLLESSDFHSQENSYSFICFNPLAGLKAEDNTLHYFFPGNKRFVRQLEEPGELLNELEFFCQLFSVAPNQFPFQNGLFGYTSYDAAGLFNETRPGKGQERDQIPGFCYAVYQNIISINHINDEAWLYCFSPDGTNNLREVEDLLTGRSYLPRSFRREGEEKSNYTDEEFDALVHQIKDRCKWGDVFQVVLSRQYTQAFSGDDFNVYRALRSLNPSPYLFYFDFGSYRIFGSSPESQLMIKGNRAIMQPIAGMLRRSGNDKDDEELAIQLTRDTRRDTEHTILIDVARNDLSQRGTDVRVEKFKEVQFYSQVVQLISTISATLHPSVNKFRLIASTFPAGSSTGAPKGKAMELIGETENRNRQCFGGAIGYMGFNGDFNHAIIVRSFLSKEQELHYQAGTPVSSLSNGEVQEVLHKVEGMHRVIEFAEVI